MYVEDWEEYHKLPTRFIECMAAAEAAVHLGQPPFEPEASLHWQEAVQRMLLVYSRRENGVATVQ
jgi:hypothetical protein